MNTENTTDTVTIPRDEYDQLTKDSNFLARLEAAGVDNWDGYPYGDDDEN